MIYMIYYTEIIKFNSIPYIQLNFSVANSYVHLYTQKNTARFVAVLELLFLFIFYITAM